MSFRYGFLCVLACLVILVLAVKNYELGTQPMEGVFRGEEMKRGDPGIEGTAMMGGPVESTSLASTILISEKNIFHPERREFSATPLDQTKPTMRPQIILYGVTLKEDYQSATIVNPGRPLRKGEREMMTLRMGDRIGDYKLSKISPDRITMETEEDSFEVLLFDPNLPKRRTIVRTESKPATVTSTAPAPTPVPAPTPTPTPKAPEAPKPEEPSRERVREAPLPRPVSPPPPSYPSAWRGRRPITPSQPPGAEGQ